MSALRVKQCWQSASMEALGFIGENRLFGIGMLLRLLRVVLLLSVWRLVLTGRGSVSGMTLGSVLTYTLVSEMFADLLQCRTWLEDAFWSGSIVTRMLRPMGLFLQFSSEMFGTAAVSFALFSVPLFVCAPLLGVRPFPASVTAAVLFPVSLALAVSVGLALEFVFTGIAVLAEIPPFALNSLRTAITGLLSGAFIPLALLPHGVGVALAWLPFASQASAPLRIYTGTGGDALALIGGQIAWTAILWPVAHAIWNRARERMVTYGG